MTAPLRIPERAPALVGISSYARLRTSPTEQKFSIPTGYVDAVRAAGAVPIVLPSGEPEPRKLLDPLGALIISGGGDIDPVHYGGATHDAVYSVCGERDTFEFGLTRAALADTRVPMLCICRGLQVLNVVCGGSLHVHLPDVVGDAVNHRAPEKAASAHSVRIDPNSRLAAILGVTECEVASWHHQAIERVGDRLRPVAWAADGVIEAVEHVDHPWCIAVQWHPEMRLGDPIQQRLFRALVGGS
ncbi:MAG: gamma-glutamyl-gamma-aminobutyrate hydrolase family protein [Deltaproteobacteria bacterium]|nr:gamma-glutamyl-gamma-aminobutyrate hydrolase family protein [Deltaproteobacteria bacterium]